MPNSNNLSNTIPPDKPRDELARIVEQIRDALAVQEYQVAAQLVEANIAAVWFGFDPAELAGVLRHIAHHVGNEAPLLVAAYEVLTASSRDETNAPALFERLDLHDTRQLFVLAMFRMRDYRLHGHTRLAIQQADLIDEYLETLRPELSPRGGWLLQGAVEVATTAILAGDFPRALTSLMSAQMQPAAPAYTFLEREAFVKSALIHAAFGNASTAQSLLARATQVPRTSSWQEATVDTHFAFASILSDPGAIHEAVDRLEDISLHEIGEMWPFYVVALHRLMEAAGQHDELDHRLHMLDQLPLPRIDREGFTGSVLPLKRAMVALSAGRGTQALEFLERADTSLAYTRLMTAAANLYVGRFHQALELADELAPATRGFRIKEIRRLSILSAAHYMLGDSDAAAGVLQEAADLPRGLSHDEVLLFGKEIQDFARTRIPTWPKYENGRRPIFLATLPWKTDSLTSREIQILEHLAQGMTRAQIADRLFISISTVKTQVQSIYRKFGVTSAAEAIQEGEQRGLL